MRVQKIDYRKELRHLFGGKPGQIVTVDVPPMNFLMIDGHGDPNTSPEYAGAIQTLYPLAYTIKFMCKQQQLEDFPVMPLEGIWWTPDMREFSTDDKSTWEWTAMIMQPAVVTPQIFGQAVEKVAAKQKPPLLDRVRFESYHEGRAAQVMYLGPFADEGPTIQRLHDYIAEQGGVLGGDTKHHHEIYLSDPRRTAPEKLRTVIRQPY